MKVLLFILSFSLSLSGISQTTQNLIMNNSFEYLNRTSSLYGGPAGGDMQDTNFATSVLPCWSIPNTVHGSADVAVLDPILQDIISNCPDCFPNAQNQNQLIWLTNDFRYRPALTSNYFYNSTVQTRLATSLVAGTTYRLSGYLNTITNTDTTGNSIYQNSGAEFKRIGFYFSPSRPLDNYTSTASAFFSITPTVEYTVQHIAQNLSNTNPWQRFDLVFTATGGERYLTLGNFDSTLSSYYLYPVVDSFVHRHVAAGDIQYMTINIDTYLDNLTLVPITDTGLTVINPHIADPDSMLGPRDTISCSNTPITIGAGADFLSYQWSTGATTRTIQVATPGTYTLTVDNGCGVYADTISILPDNTTRPNYHIPDTTLCSDHSFTYTLPASLATGQVRWSNGNSTLQSTFSYGSYHFSYRNQCYSYSDTFAISYSGADTVRVFADTAVLFCPGASFVLSPGATYPSYAWSDHSSGPSITVTQPGYYSLTVTDAQHCQIADTIHYHQPILPLSLLAADSIIRCATAYPVTVTAAAGFSSYSWNGAAGTQQYTVTAPGQTVYAEGTTLCGTVRDTIYSRAITEATGLSYTIDSDCSVHSATVLVTPIGSPALLWSTGAATAEIHTLLPAVLKVAARYTCTTIIDTIILPACASLPALLFIPNAFTPNGDGINDRLEIYGDKVNWKFIQLSIFDRWGEKVYDSNDMDSGWDGTYRGSALSGVFVYEFTLTRTDGQSQHVTGSITVIR